MHAAANPSLPVLIVEDNEMNLQLIRHQLDRLGLAGTAAVRNGREALDWLSRHQCKVILADCQMPVMDGFEMTRAIRQREQASREHIWIIAVTAGVMEQNRARCLEAGMDDYIAKPVRLEKLKAALHRWLPD